MVRDDSEIKACAVQNACRYCNLELMTPELRAAALAPDASLGPRFASPAALVARAAHGHLERHHGAVARFAPRQSDRRAQCGGPLVGEKRVPHAVDSRRHRWKIDDDLVREAVRIRTTAGTGGDGR